VKVKIGNGLLPINVLVIVLIVAITLSFSGTLRIILGLPLVVFSPGYALITALFPKRDDLDGVERLALSFVMSIAVVALIGLIINYTPWGIRLYPVLASLAIFIVVTSAIAWYRWWRLASGERFTVSFNLSLPAWLGQTTLEKTLCVILVIVILGAICTLAYTIVKPKTGERFTEFYILGVEGKVIDYPTELRVGEEGKVMVGIINREHETVTYRVEVRINGVKNNEWGPLVLDHDEKREEVISFHPRMVGDEQKVDFLLYKNEQSEPYLTPLRLWVNVNE